jgi:hypothetical protein
MRKTKLLLFTGLLTLLIFVSGVNAETWSFDTGFDGWTPGGTYDNPVSPFPHFEKPWGTTLLSGGIVLDSCDWWGYDSISKTITIPDAPAKIKIHIVKMDEPEFYDGVFQLRVGGNFIGEQYVPDGYDNIVTYQIPDEFSGTSQVVELRSIGNGCDGEHIGIDSVEISTDGVSVPEFPSAFLPAIMIIGFLGTVLLIQRTREH